jgi:oligoendopeptidase F
MLRRFVFFLLLARLPHSLACQQAPAFNPFPRGLDQTYRFDLARNFYRTSDVAAAARRDVLASFRLLAARINHVNDGPSLYNVLAITDTLTRELMRQYSYYSLRSSIDTRDQEAGRASGELGATTGPVLSELQRKLGSVSSSQFAAYVRTEPRLAKYSYAVTLARAENARRPDSAADRLLSAAEAEAARWGPSLFQATMANIRFGTVHGPDGELDVLRNGNQIRSHPDRAVREAGYRLNQAALATRRDTFALILTRTADIRNKLARQRGWPDYPTQFYAAGGLEPRQVRALLESVAKRSDINKRYERHIVAAIRRDFGYDTVHFWDLTAPSKGKVAPRFDIEAASREVLAAAAPLGEGYVRELRSLLDPRNGRLDLITRANRVDRPGFSTGLVGFPSMFFQGRFEGYTDDLVILAHEAGHAVQNMLMDSAGVLPRYASGPSYFTESFATLSQLLLLEHLFRSASSEADREYYRRRLLDDALAVFRNSWESLLELQIYDSVAAGRNLNANGIEKLTQNVASRFSVWFGGNDGRALAWVQPIQFYTWPLYRSNYVIANLLALQYLDKLHRDPVGFTKKYGALLRHGYDAPPEELLQRFLGVSLSNPDSLVTGAVNVMQQWLDDPARLGL